MNKECIGEVSDRARKTEVLERYFGALRSNDWETLAACVAEDVHRNGPYLDIVEGRAAYTAYLESVVPSLAGYALEVSRIDFLESGAALVRLSEHVEVGGRPTEFPEALVFEFDQDCTISAVDIYIKQPPGSR